MWTYPDLRIGICFFPLMKKFIDYTFDNELNEMQDALIQQILSRKGKMKKNCCYICDTKLPIFIITPILELPDGRYENCCEKCADREFPGWEQEDLDIEEE